MNLIFERNGIPFSMAFDKNIPIVMALIYYLIEIEDEKTLLNLINNVNLIYFIYDVNKYSIKDFSLIKNIFKYSAKILVIEKDSIIG